MPDEAAHSAGKRFADDLHRIREERGVTTDAFHNETKIPRGVIQSFEETGLFNHPMFNRVYLRSFVRAYARAVDIPSAAVLKGLEQALAGDYEHQLSDEHLGGAPAEEAEQAASAEEKPSASEETARRDAERRGKRTIQSAGPPPSEKRSGTVEESAEEEAAAGAAAEASADQREAARTQRSGGRRTRRERSSRRRARGDSADRQSSWMYVGLAVLVIGLAIGLFLFLSGEGETDADAEQAAASTADTASAAQPVEETAEPAAEPAEPVAIGDSLDFVVAAARGPVRELRVKRDDDLRRPYWIEEGDSRTFTVANRITFEPPIDSPGEQPLDMIRLELEGRSYPTDRRDAQGRIVVTRQTAQAYLDSLARQ